MNYNVAFISLGCAKNQVNCEQMMATVQAAGHNVCTDPEGADVVVINTCGFLASACGEAIDNILEMAALKLAGRVKKILVTGCMAQRYQKDILAEMPEVDGVLGTGSYGDIAKAIDEVMEIGIRPCHFGNIHTAEQGGEDGVGGKLRHHRLQQVDAGVGQQGGHHRANGHPSSQPDPR